MNDKNLCASPELMNLSDMQNMQLLCALHASYVMQHMCITCKDSYQYFPSLLRCKKTWITKNI